MLSQKLQSFAVIGAGIAGAACAHALGQAGHAVHVFDKSRGPGGRMATRRIDWVDSQGQNFETRLDHGAVSITAHTAAFQQFVDQAVTEGCLTEWTPSLFGSGMLPEGNARHWLPVPDMPALCRHLLDGMPTTGSYAIDKLHHGPLGWQAEAAGQRHAATFDAVVLALPPAQAAPLLAPHRPDWARNASLAPMQPCWTLMGIEDIAEASPSTAAHWDLAHPPAGPVASILRSDTRPGRGRVAGQAHWVVHARPDWSSRHLEQPADEVQTQMQAALAEFLGRPVNWLHCNVHRWRYATAQAQVAAPPPTHWCDPRRGLGVCGDFLGGGGVEGAWLSARALATALLHPHREGHDAPANNRFER